MLPPLDAERAMDARAAATWPHMKDGPRRSANRSLLKQIRAGQPRQKPKRATKADLAAAGIGVTEVVPDG